MAGQGFLEHLHPPRLSSRRIAFGSTFCLGGLAFLLFLSLGLSGGVLMLQYVPTPQGAGEFFAQEPGGIPFLWFFRRVHFLAGQAMVLAVFLHLARVLATGAHLPPRGINWLVGLSLLWFTLFLDLTGYVLRWDAATQSAATVVANLVGEISLAGPVMERILLGGPALGPSTLLRFYVLHCLALPMACLGLTMFHFWRIRKDGKTTRGL